MRGHPTFSLLTSPTTMSTATSSSHPHPKPRKPSLSTATSSSSSLLCRHHSPSASATATLDLLILILVLISGTFLLTSYFSYLFNSLSLLLPFLSLSLSLSLPLPSIVVSFAVFSLFSAALCFCDFGFLFRSRRKCGNPKCKGLKKALEFDLQLQTEDSFKTTNGHTSSSAASVAEIDKLPWKGGSEGNPDYECLRAELRKMAPPNGRAVLLFRAKCGCPVAKLVGWGPKKGRKHKKSLASVAANGDHH